MKRLRLFTAFHANLDFSAMPEADLPRVLAACYWPLLALPAEHGIRIGFEASARTLSILEREDPEWIKSFRGLAERGLIEPIASGHAQIVAPLTPVEINRANLRLGNEAYAELLGSVPETFFVNEQTWADALTPLYVEAGAKNLVMEWNNPASRRPALRALRCRPARLRVPGGGGPRLLWNDSIVFQKMQRIAHGEIPFSELAGLLDRLWSTPGAGALCLYGGDVEIFDYRPSRPTPKPAGAEHESEIERLIRTFRAIAADPRFEFVLPREVVPQAVDLPEVELGSTGMPIACKKQPRYNPTRWAVSGRDGFGMNTRCHAALRSERAAGRLARKLVDSPRELVDLWRSDFRTRATEEKIVEFEAGIGAVLARGHERLDRAMPPLEEGEQVALANPGDEDWSGGPVALPLELRAGQAFALDVGMRGGRRLAPEAGQVEVVSRHRDGSIRRATLVLCPEVPARGRIGLTLIPRAEASGEASSQATSSLSHWSSDAVEVDFLPHRGAAIQSLRFPQLAPETLLGTIPHGFFDAIEYTPDFYSGHVVAATETGVKRTSLGATQLQVVPSASGGLRVTLLATVDTPLGPWQTLYRVYRTRPRLDVVHDLAFHDARLASLRLGICTLRPEGWDRSSLRYGTTHGGPQAEWRALSPGERVAHSAAVSSGVSATSCLGATEGWVAFEDHHHGLLIQGDRDQAAVVPMLDFEDVDESFFCRISHSAAEIDETRASFLRGRRPFGFSIEGYLAGDAGLLTRARQRHEGLVYRTETNLGITRGV